MRYMLDTNICIYSIKHKPKQVFFKLQEHDPEDICIPSVTYATVYPLTMILRIVAAQLLILLFS